MARLFRRSFFGLQYFLESITLNLDWDLNRFCFFANGAFK